MEYKRYHLVFEGFLRELNRTEISLALKTELQLSDAQVADLMAGRRTVLQNNLPKESAQTLGRKLTKQGLKVSAQALSINQKNNPADLRRHLMDGGIDQYFASRFKHPDEELDTLVSLLILAGFAVLTYLVLPLIGLRLLVPTLSVSAWLDHPAAVLFQLLFALIFFAPLLWLWPRSSPVDGIELDKETEELLEQLVRSMAYHLSAPTVSRIVLVQSPVLAIRQTPLAWIQNQATLEVGLPVLEALNLQQFVGLLAMRLCPLSGGFYARTWGLFMQWYNALRTRYKPWALLLNNWVLPMHQHQAQRSAAIASDLVGLQETKRLQRIEKRFSELNRDWPEFTVFCQKMRIRGTHWHELVAKETSSDDQADEVQALFRMAAPALWILSTSDGYQRAFGRKQGQTPAFETSGVELWQQFQRFTPAQEQFQKLMIRPEALVPPSEAPKRQNALNALRLNRLASDVLQSQQQRVEQALGLPVKVKKMNDMSTLVTRWRAASASFWPDNFMQHTRFPLAKDIFLSLQTLQQLRLWAIEDRLVDVSKRRARDKQIMALYAKWLAQTALLPPLPLIRDHANTLQDQVQHSVGSKLLAEFDADGVVAQLDYWLTIMVCYWTLVAGQILQPRTLSEDVAG
ncbi:hypothetical protein [Reinekea sp.]|jgi:hypothetical protein|uniref:hypothetical protein n=1 Tax=Reinekea sp. TaxID=1970455 RepID=UPI002A7F2049|nr:hypothetical protein [Reinekea sp.]